MEWILMVIIENLDFAGNSNLVPRFYTIILNYNTADGCKKAERAHPMLDQILMSTNWKAGYPIRINY
jgi:hypothetical protein